MKKWLALLFIACLTSVGAAAQNGAINGYCVQGATQASTSGSPSSNYLQGVVPTCTITVYLTGTTTLATIYSDVSGTPLTNPFNSAFSGQWLFYAAEGQAYDVLLSGGTYPNIYTIPVTLTGLFSGGSGGGGGSITALGGQSIAGGGTQQTSTTTGVTGSLANSCLLLNTTLADYSTALNGCFSASGILDWQLPIGTFNVGSPVTIPQNAETVLGSGWGQTDFVTTATNLTSTSTATSTAATAFAIVGNVATVLATNDFTVGQQVVLTNWVTATYFNNLTVTLTAATGNSYSFALSHADVLSTADTGLAMVPVVNLYAPAFGFNANVGYMNINGTNEPNQSCLNVSASIVNTVSWGVMKLHDMALENCPAPFVSWSIDNSELDNIFVQGTSATTGYLMDFQGTHGQNNVIATNIFGNGERGGDSATAPIAPGAGAIWFEEGTNFHLTTKDFDGIAGPIVRCGNTALGCFANCTVYIGNREVHRGLDAYVDRASYMDVTLGTGWGPSFFLGPSMALYQGAKGYLHVNGLVSENPAPFISAVATTGGTLSGTVSFCWYADNASAIIPDGSWTGDWHTSCSQATTVTLTGGSNAVTVTVPVVYSTANNSGITYNMAWGTTTNTATMNVVHSSTSTTYTILGTESPIVNPPGQSGGSSNPPIGNIPIVTTPNGSAAISADCTQAPQEAASTAAYTGQDQNGAYFNVCTSPSEVTSGGMPTTIGPYDVGRVYTPVPPPGTTNGQSGFVVGELLYTSSTPIYLLDNLLNLQANINGTLCPVNGIIGGPAVCTISGGGNTTSTSLTTNFLPKANGPNSIINSSASDNGTTFVTTEPVTVSYGIAFTTTSPPTIQGSIWMDSVGTVHFTPLAVGVTGSDFANITSGGAGIFNGHVTAGGGLTIGNILGSTQCLHVGATGVVSGTGADCGSGGASALSSITAATGANTIPNGNNGAQVWNWAQTTGSQTAFTFGETTAATGTSDLELAVKTLTGSTAVPLTASNSLSGSQTLPALQILPTWNTSGVVDAALLINATNTASGTGSLLIDAQVGSSSVFSVDKLGDVIGTKGTFANLNATVALLVGPAASSIVLQPADTVANFAFTSGSSSREAVSSFGGSSYHSAVAFGGTSGSPTAVASGAEVGGFNAFAYNGTALGTPMASFRVYANQTQAVGASGSYADITTTPNGSTAQAEVIKFNNDGGITTPGQTDQGAGDISANSFYAATLMSSPLINVTGTTPGATELVAGTGSIAALTANGAGFVAPNTGGTSYLFKLPGTITGAGILHAAATATGDGVNESALTNSLIAIADFSASGTPSSSTYLRGDNFWGTPGSGPPNTQFTNVPVGSATTVEGTAVTTNQIKLAYVYIPQPGLSGITDLVYSVTTGDNTTNLYDFGLYGPGCINGATSIPLAGHIGASLGSTVAPSGGRFHTALTATEALTAGDYCFAWTSSATTPLVVLGGTTGTNYAPFPVSTVAAQTSTSGVLPSTITAPTLAGTANSPLVYAALTNY